MRIVNLTVGFVPMLCENPDRKLKCVHLRKI
ncbi:Uncharacterised protein [Yersinia similis]|uniref:Uncharacterized protein n=1 Tax=Yersinia similis TaxID=367190 RepID=A0A0T9RLY9_9GAMM|nr:Uncharacterised protein [Yersinia similis]CNI71212.1 Uncharacterised protein [Yersinia similis]